ncbi:MAG TPA: type II and III secretion system protein, partial [Gammaproteobacteria bacterium]|nr:type II and III secretion system protein [Gammaproteobacteria bacterium]
RTLAAAQQRSYTFWGIGTSILSMINVLEANGAAMTLTNPRLSTRSGGKANLTVGGEVPVVTSSVSGTSVTYKDYGILLEIEPTLDRYDNLMARVSIEVSALDLSNAVDGQPAFKKRSSENDIKLIPGDTLALAGLIQREEQIAYSGIKWLSDIPGLGNLFRNKSFTEGETELVILITPTPIDDMQSGDNKAMLEISEGILDEFNKAKEALAR